MSLTFLCTCIVAFYAVIWFFDSFFKSCMHYPYFAFLEGTGLQVGIFNFTWKTTTFNRCIYRWGKNFSRFLNKWFSVGYLVTIWLFLPFSLWTLISFVFNNFSKDVQFDNVPDVKAVLPGVNIPTSDFWLYFISMSVSSILHELGHALAAAQEDVQLISVGMFVFAILPVAYVQLNVEHLNSVDIRKRLKIYCAGVWHNIAVAFLAMLLYMLTPVLFSLAYKTDLGVRVTGITQGSHLDHPRGFAKDSIITAINRCEVKSAADWTRCLHGAHGRFGICTTQEFVADNDEMMVETIQENDVVECCRKTDIYSICFEYMEPKVVVESLLPGQFSCLEPRKMIEHGFDKCTEAEGYACPKGMHCLKPSLNNHTYLIIVESKVEKPIVYMGYPYDLYKDVTIDEYFPRYSFFSHFSPIQFEKLMRYIFIFSMGIGFINVLPCYGTDGHHIARNILQMIANKFDLTKEFVTFGTIFTIIIGTGITTPTLIYMFYKSIIDP